MLDLLAAIVSADPPALLAWLVLAFAAGMYPVGIMLGASCSPCCGPSNPCSLCTAGELPDTLTVTFNGLQDQTPGPDLCLLTFSAPYGSGAAGKVTAPGGDPATDKGPITAVSLTNGGSGYAKLGRVAPTITASGGSGAGATFSVSTASTNDANGIPSWGVTGVTWTGTTSGYVNGEQITFEVAEGDTAEQGAAATIQTVRTQPTVTASASGGTGATLGVTIAANGTTPQTWSVTAISVTSGGTGYPASGYVTFNVASGDTEEQPAYAIFYCGRVAPTVMASASGSGSGASLSASLASATGYDGLAYWYVDGISITNGGAGYAEFDQIAFTVTDGEGYGAYAEVSSVDEDGAITGVSVYWGGEYFKSDGVIQSVEFDYSWGSVGGVYYRDAGTIASVSVESGGVYYREDASEPPYVATVTVGISQTFPSTGTGATLTATVEDDTSSANFGKVTGVTIGNGGNNYLAWQWRNTKCCGDFYNGLSVVVKRLNYGSGDACRYEHRLCGVGNIRGNVGSVEVEYRGPSIPPLVRLRSELANTSDPVSSICNTTFTASGNVTNCSDWSGVSFSATGSATASVTTGGEYDATDKNPNARSCSICCKGDSETPAEIEATINDPRTSKAVDFSGTYVLPWRGQAAGFGGIIPSGSVWFTSYQPPNPPPSTSPSVFISVWTEPCSSQTTTGFGLDDWGCDDCHKKCRERASVILANDGSAAGQCGYTTAIDEQTACGLCVDTPICSMAGKSFQLQSPTCSGTVTLTT